MKANQFLAAFALATQVVTAEPWASDPAISEEDAENFHEELGNYGSEALQTYEKKYGKMNEGQRQQFLWEQNWYEQVIKKEWLSDLQAQRPDIMVTRVGGSGSLLEIVVTKATQRMTVKISGNEVPGLTNIRISTGKSSSMTPNGQFRLTGKEIVKRRINRQFSTAKRKVYLEDAVQVNGGIFIHKASIPAQKNTLGRPASHGCIRVDREVSAKVFDLAQMYKSNAVVIIK